MSEGLVRIGLVMEHSLSFFREVLRGVTTFATDRPHWMFTPIAASRSALESARRLGCRGFIANVYQRSLGAAMRAARRPVVNVAGVELGFPFPRVRVDHVEVGRLAARHLVSCGCRRLAFVGYRRLEFSVGREQGLKEVAAEIGARVDVFHDRIPSRQDANGLWRWNPRMVAWLDKLPKPVGVLASHDPQGQQVAEYCRHLRLTAPDQVAIVGADDDDLLCELSRPSLSSVRLPAERIGFEAARLLDGLLAGRAPEQSVLVLPPAGVVVRQSSNLQAASDPHVAAAVRFIHAQAHQPIAVDDVLRAAPIARRSLERRFRKQLQRSILDEIRRAHVERAKHLLLTTDLPMSEVAVRCGLGEGRKLSILFAQLTGGTPSQFRRQQRVVG